MSDSSRPYKSHLFNFVNRHSLRLRDRLGETFRHLKIVAEWGAQVLVLPFNWLFQPNKWDGPVLPPGRKQAALKPVEYLSSPPVDQPLGTVMSVIEPWFELPELKSQTPFLITQNRLSTVALSPESSFSKPLVPQIVLTSAFFEQVRQHLTPNNLDSSDLAHTEALSAPALPPSPLGQLVKNFKNSFRVIQSEDIVIQGLACLLENRQLVLTTTENDLLEVLSTDQQQTIQQAIARELAAFNYEKRLQWTLSQKRLGFISLVKSDSQKTYENNAESDLVKATDHSLNHNLTKDLTVVAPVEWLYQKLRWAEQVFYNFQCNPSNSSAIIPTSVPLPTLPLLRQLDYSVAHLEEKEMEWGQRVQSQLTQSFNTLRQTPLLEASIEKTGQIIQQVNLPDKLQTLKAEIQTKLPLNALVAQSINSLDSSHNLEAREPDPFQIQILIQAAIAYFFGTSPATTLDSKGVPNSKRFAPEENWLDWDDLFIHGDRPHPAQALVPIASAPPLTKPPKIRPKALTKTDSPHLPIPPSSPPPHLPSSPPSSISPSPHPSISPSPHLPPPPSLSKPWEVELEAAFDWIETEGKAIGYHKHPLEWILETLDQIVLWLEETLKKIWHWFHQQYLARAR